MFIYQEEENKCGKFSSEYDWYVYPWHSESGGIIFPGRVVKYWLESGITDWNKVKDKKEIYELTVDIFTHEYRDVGLEFKCVGFDNYLVPQMTITNDIIEKLLLPESSVNILHMIEAATVGYLRNRYRTVQGVVYGSTLHKQLNVFVCD